MFSPLIDSAPGPSVLIWLFVALFVALAFEFVNGFHDTANAVATVIYTRALRPWSAVLLSGLCNFVGVMLSGVGVAYAIVNLLPPQVFSQEGGAGGSFAIIFAVLLAAIVWNLATWSVGIPASSSHALIGAIIGVGLANSLVAPGMSFGQGVAWDRAQAVGMALLVSPLLGFAASAAILSALKAWARDSRIHDSPSAEAPTPPPFWVRVLLVSSCAGVSLAHGSNDGQKGMGLVMLILIALVPAGFALNLTSPTEDVRGLAQSAYQVSTVLGSTAKSLSQDEITAALEQYLRQPGPSLALTQALQAAAAMTADRLQAVSSYAQIPAGQRWRLRHLFVLTSRVLNALRASGYAELHLTPIQTAQVETFHQRLKHSTQYVSNWVKLAVALAIGLGTMVGWKRVVVTVGEKIGKGRLTYAQGASAQVVAMVTILAADSFGLPVSTTHILSSGVAGTMAGGGLQKKTLTNIILAWVLTLPATIALSFTFYFLLRHF